MNDLLKGLGDELQGFIHGCPKAITAQGLRRWPDRDFNADIRRLAREVGHRRVGLALSSGGARGFAHIGVIQVLEENGIEVDVVAGCSMGSYIGAVWAAGYDGVAMERQARELEHRWGLFDLIDPFILPRQGFLRGEKVKQRLKRAIGDVHFSELVRPLRIVATHLACLDRVVFSSGEVAAAVHASSAIPGACVPVEVDGELYIDGGIADPLPVDVLQEMGIERIIAINTIPTPAYLRDRLALIASVIPVVIKDPSDQGIHQSLPELFRPWQRARYDPAQLQWCADASGGTCLPIRGCSRSAAFIGWPLARFSSSREIHRHRASCGGRTPRRN